MFFPKRCPAQLAFLLEHPVRRWLLNLDRLVTSLRLPQGGLVLDLGAGSGVVAAAVMNDRPDVRVVLFDAQRRMLRRARGRLFQVAGIRPTLIVGLGEFLPFPECQFDTVLMVTVLGEVDDAGAVLREVHRVLRPGAVLSISEQLPDPDFRSLGRVRALLRSGGFKERDVSGGRWSYTINAVRLAT